MHEHKSQKKEQRLDVVLACQIWALHWSVEIGHLFDI